MMKSSKRLVFYFIFLAIFAAHITYAANPDMAYQKKIIFDIRKKGDGLHYLTSTVKEQYLFLSERSTRNAKYSIYEPFYAKISKLKVKFRNKRLKKSYLTTSLVDYRDIFISNVKVHDIHFPGDIHQGDTAIISYKQEFENIAFLPLITIPNIDYVEAYDLIFKHPKNTLIDFEIFSSRESIDYDIDRTDQRQTTLCFNRLDYKKPLAYYPFNDFHAGILVKITENGQPVNPFNPEDFIKWYGDKVDLSPKLDVSPGHSLDEEMKRAPSSLQKLKIIYEYVQKNIRYIADHRGSNAYTPREPYLTFENNYGDCKDRAYLVSALAKNYGIDVNMALLNTEPAPPFKSSHVAEFNHVICAYNNGGQMLYFDPISKYCEFGNLPENEIGKKVFILNKEKPRFEVIPSPNFVPSIEIVISGDLSYPENCTAVVVLRNDYFHQAVYAKNELTGVALENVLSQLISLNLYSIILENFQPIKKDISSLTLHAKADLSNFIISSATKKYIPKTAFLVIDKEVMNRKTDDYFIQLQSRSHLKMKIDLKATGYQAPVNELTLGKEGDTYFSSSISQGDSNRLTILYNYQQPMKYFNFEKKDSFLKFCVKYLKSKTEMFILRDIKL